ncbi:hypothetical protein YO5_09155 [Stutzerimonas stutzeri TS44]|nr:hypothetical protein YO5_09155 [Stutzerimonas stutzeri TS44]
MTGDGLSLYGVPGAFESGTQLVEIRARMAGHSDFERCERLVDAALAIMARCLPWLTDEGASDLCCAAYLKTDSISQNVAYASPARLADEVMTAAGMFDAADMPAIAAFAFACAAHALRALEDWLQGDAGDELDGVSLFRAYMAEIDGCVSSAAIGLSPDEDDECNALGTAAAYASNLAADKANGLLSAIARRGSDGTEERDRLIAIKACELLISGTKLHNLIGKLRQWQARETGEALTKPAMKAVLLRKLPWLWPDSVRVNQLK